MLISKNCWSKWTFVSADSGEITRDRYRNPSHAKIKDKPRKTVQIQQNCSSYTTAGLLNRSGAKETETGTKNCLETSWRCPDLHSQFILFSKFANSGSDGTLITLRLVPDCEAHININRYFFSYKNFSHLHNNHNKMESFSFHFTCKNIQWAPAMAPISVSQTGGWDKPTLLTDGTLPPSTRP